MKSDCLYHTKLLYADILTQAHSQRLQNHPQLSAPMCPGMAASAVSLRKSYDIVILSFCNIVKGQANCINVSTATMVDINLPKKMVDL